MRYLHIILLSLVMLTGCGNDEEFVVNCEIRGLGSTGVEMYYTTRSLQHSGFHPVDGKVTLRGVAYEPTLIEVSTTDGEPLFMCVARNGEHLNVKMDMADRSTLKIKGNDVSEQLSAFVAANDSLLRSGDVVAVNRLIAEEVRSHPDRMASAALLVTHFNARGHELEADSLINVLKPSARANWVMGAYPGLVGEQVSSAARGNVKAITVQTGRQDGRDTVVRYWPSNQSYSMLVITGQGKGDSVGSVLKILTEKLPIRRFKALEVAVLGDSSAWALSVARDTAAWMQCWVAGGTGAPVISFLHVPAVPFFIVVDSLGKQIYRGLSVKAAEDSVSYRLEAYLKEKNDSVEEDSKDPAVTTESAATPSASKKPDNAAPAVPSRPSTPPSATRQPASRQRPALRQPDAPQRVTDGKAMTIKKDNGQR